MIVISYVYMYNIGNEVNEYFLCLFSLNFFVIM